MRRVSAALWCSDIMIRIYVNSDDCEHSKSIDFCHYRIIYDSPAKRQSTTICWLRFFALVICFACQRNKLENSLNRKMVNDTKHLQNTSTHNEKWVCVTVSRSREREMCWRIALLHPVRRRERTKNKQKTRWTEDAKELCGICAKCHRHTPARIELQHSKRNKKKIKADH